MVESRTSLLTLGALAVLSVVVVFTATRIVGLDGRITEALSAKELAMQTLTTTVTQTSTGDLITVVTPRIDGESDATHVARHKSLCAAAKAG